MDKLVQWIAEDPGRMQVLFCIGGFSFVAFIALVLMISGVIGEGIAAMFGGGGE